MGDENFYEAAIRHLYDGKVLEQREEYDNAVCMQGFAAECALKKMLERVCSREEVRRYSHFGDVLFEDIKMMLLGDMGLTAIIDPACALRLSAILLPEILFSNHPERRYFEDGIYSKEDAEACKNAAEALVKEMVYMCLDGYIRSRE